MVPLAHRPYHSLTPLERADVRQQLRELQQALLRRGPAPATPPKDDRR